MNTFFLIWGLVFAIANTVGLAASSRTGSFASFLLSLVGLGAAVYLIVTYAPEVFGG